MLLSLVVEEANFIRVHIRLLNDEGIELTDRQILGNILFVISIINLIS